MKIFVTFLKTNGKEADRSKILCYQVFTCQKGDKTVHCVISVKICSHPALISSLISVQSSKYSTVCHFLFDLLFYCLWLYRGLKICLKVQYDFEDN